MLYAGKLLELFPWCTKDSRFLLQLTVKIGVSHCLNFVYTLTDNFWSAIVDLWGTHFPWCSKDSRFYCSLLSRLTFRLIYSSFILCLITFWKPIVSLWGTRFPWYSKKARFLLQLTVKVGVSLCLHFVYILPDNFLEAYCKPLRNTFSMLFKGC